MWRNLPISLVILLFATGARAQESPYVVTYDHHMEEPGGNLEVEASITTDVPRSGQRFYAAPYAEFEYGVTTRWTSELYLESQSTWNDSTVFTGWRIENRFRPLKREHRINPVLYLEYEQRSEASRIQKEIEGGAPDVTSPNSQLNLSKVHELESKLILSSDVHDWNLAGNFIAAKNFSRNEGIEFGYSLGFSHPLRTLASGSECHFCRENFSAGAEFYGGLGSTLDFGLKDTAHYAAPVIAWLVSDNVTLRFSPGIGLTRESNPVLLRFGYSYEVKGLTTKLARLFGSSPR
ncbi:MAG: hypothetical protein M3O09_19625 [Acidobacteriota bacterium]|nr:hypothetical protein [Acidobacteriota bacterium]